MSPALLVPSVSIGWTEWESESEMSSEESEISFLAFDRAFRSKLEAECLFVLC